MPTARTRAARHAAQPLAEALQRLERAPHGAMREHAVAGETGGEPHGIAQAIEDVHAAVRFGARHHHVEAVRAEVDARDDLFARGRRSEDAVPGAQQAVVGKPHRLAAPAQLHRRAADSRS